MPLSVDTKSARAVAGAALEVFQKQYPDAPTGLLETLFRDIEDMFEGRYLEYQAVDMPYHDFEHTLQVTLCLVRLLEGRHRAKIAPRLTARHFECAVAAALLHDTGYIKLRSDQSGTGAKYTNVHVIRSCALAASYLLTLGFNSEEVHAAVAAIRCTEPNCSMALNLFSNEIDKHLGCLLATADYVGQMAAPGYVEDLPNLFQEFQESEDFMHTPPAGRPFHNARELIEKTAVFWGESVLPSLINDYQGVYRYLADPYPDGPNPYVQDIERNIARARAIAGVSPEPQATRMAR